MTENEAIKYIQRDIYFINKMIEHDKRFDPKADINRYLNSKTAYEMAIAALEEIRQYRDIGTVEECKEASEKRKPKKPLGGVDIAGNEYMICPYCSAIVEDGEWRADYCPDCGQSIRWDENLEEKEDE